MLCEFHGEGRGLRKKCLTKKAETKPRFMSTIKLASFVALNASSGRAPWIAKSTGKEA